MAEHLEDTLSSGPELPSMFWAAVCASAVPIVLGFMGLFPLLTLMKAEGDYFFDILFGLPTALCFIFGTPLVALLSCRALIRQARNNEPDVFKLLGVSTEAAKYSFYVHSCGFLATVIILLLLEGGEFFLAVVVSLFLGGFINILLFLFVTVPMSLFCAVIFRIVYSVPNTAPEGKS